MLFFILFFLDNNPESSKNNRNSNLSEDEEGISIKNKNFKNLPNNTPNINDNNVESEYVTSEPNEADNLFDIFYKLHHNTDLNVLIKTINNILIKEKKKPFDKSDFTITLGAKELDKFFQLKNVDKEFAVNICYSLFE